MCSRPCAAEDDHEGVGAGVERTRRRAKDEPHPRYVPTLYRSVLPGPPLTCPVFLPASTPPSVLVHFAERLWCCRSHVRRLFRPRLRHAEVDPLAVGGRGLRRGNMTRHRLLSPVVVTGRRALLALSRLRSCAIIVATSYTNLLYIPAASTNLNCRTHALAGAGIEISSSLSSSLQPRSGLDPG